MKPYLAGEHPVRFAHRGGAGLWPENTMEAFGGASELGIRYIETDVHLTADGEVVVFHDHDLGRLTNGVGKVGEWRWDDLRHLDAAFHFAPERGYPSRGTGQRIMKLVDVLAEFPEMRWNIDMKHSPVVEPLAHLVIESGSIDRIMAASFYDNRIRRFRAAAGEAVATSAGPAEVAKIALASRFGRTPKVRADAIQIPKRTVDRRLVESAHRADVAVHVWTIDDARTMHELFDMGVDGIMSDRPDVLVDVVAERGDR